MMRLLRRILFLFLLITSCAVAFPVFADSSLQDPAKEVPANLRFRDHFYLSPDLKRVHDVHDVSGLLFLKENRPDWNSKYVIVNGFDGPVLETQILPNTRNIEDIHKWAKKNLKVTHFMKVPIRELSIPKKDGVTETRFWVGQQSFPTLDLAQAGVLSAKTEIESSGGNFERSLELISEFAPEEPKEVTEEEAKANFEREEDFAIKTMDWLDIGEKLYGPFHTPTSPWGEKLLWQSFGETTFRFTNLEHEKYYAQVGFWTNRMVAKGIRGPFGGTLDPYVEVIPVLETNGIDFKSHMKLIGGIEWYPFIRNAAVQNYRPWGIPLVDFIRNYRLFVQYLFRENLKDEITGGKDTDLWAGMDIFYEWGLKLPDLDAKPYRPRFSDYLYDFVWGEYFGTYRYEKTDFTADPAFNSFILNSSVTLGVKLPGIPLPANPVNNELLFMPYLRFEHVSNPNRSLWFQNQYFVAAGLRWMPFRSYQFSENEWLFKTKLFVEYVGVGGTFRPSANTPPDTSIRDWRFGLNFSYKRF